jgi:fructose-1,6-bisphosphatase/inositol monophosphatase family enzyme
MVRPRLQPQLLCRIGEMAVYRSMWSVLRELHHPTVTEYTPGAKPDPSDITKGIDTVSQAVIDETLQKYVGPDLDRGFCIVSEERSPSFLPRPGGRPAEAEDDELVVFIDPVDFTAAAARGLDGSILVSFYHREEGMLACVVGDIYRRRIYSRIVNGASHYQEVVFAEDPRIPIGLGNKRRLTAEEVQVHFGVNELSTSGKEELANLAVNVFLSKPSRLLETAKQGARLWATGGIDEIYSVGGSLGPVRVADGTWDASIEFVRGFRVWDFAPGAFIAVGARACVIDLNTGKPFDFDFKLSRQDLRAERISLSEKLSSRELLDKDRKRFVVAATEPLAHRIRELLV